MGEFKVSIIIPFFNAGPYLKRCLDSVFRQDLDDYEIICVNDGSTDNSRDIAGEYVSTQLPVKIISQDNRGLSHARNTGMRAAEGEYIMFVDGDDYLEENVLGELYGICRKYGLDMLDFRVNVVRDGIKRSMYPESNRTSGISKGRDYFSAYIAGHGKQPFVSAWSHIYRRELITRQGLQFIEGRKYEDLVFTAGAYLGAEAVMYTDIQVYNYVKVRGSITTSGISPGHISDIQFMARQIGELSEKSGISIPMDNFFSGIRNQIVTARKTHRWKEYRELFDRDLFRSVDFHLYRPLNRVIYRLARRNYNLFLLYSTLTFLIKELLSKRQ